MFKGSKPDVVLNENYPLFGVGDGGTATGAGNGEIAMISSYPL
jgi:hypothetical protein